jgi:hypothetical protein
VHLTLVSYNTRDGYFGYSQFSLNIFFRKNFGKWNCFTACKEGKVPTQLGPLELDYTHTGCYFQVEFYHLSPVKKFLVGTVRARLHAHWMLFLSRILSSITCKKNFHFLFYRETTIFREQHNLIREGGNIRRNLALSCPPDCIESLLALWSSPLLREYMNIPDILRIVVTLELFLKRSRNRTVGVANGCGLDGRLVGVRVPVDARFFSSPRRPDRFWGPPGLLFTNVSDEPTASTFRLETFLLRR